MKQTHQDLQEHLQSLANPAKAKTVAMFFKTAPGQYGHGDQFLGLTIPVLRKTVQSYAHLSIIDLKKLIQSPWHEIRLAALLIAVAQFKQGDKSIRKAIYGFYLAHTRFINNWDLVDLSAYHIVGPMAYEEGDAILFTLARSAHLWEKRIAIVATFHFIRLGQSKEVFAISDILRNDTHDLMHKAVGWMLRESGKRISQKVLEEYLKPRYQTLPRTTLRYAIERFPEKLRQAYLEGRI